MNLNFFKRARNEHHFDDAPSAMAARLQQECAQLTTQFRSSAEFGYDSHEHKWWVRIGEVVLPQNMSVSHVPVIVTVPHNYPAEGPDDLFLPRVIASQNDWMVADVIGTSGEVRGEWTRCAITGITWRKSDDLCRFIETLITLLAVAQKVTVTLSHEQDMDNNDGRQISSTVEDMKR